MGKLTSKWSVLTGLAEAPVLDDAVGSFFILSRIRSISISSEKVDSLRASLTAKKAETAHVESYPYYPRSFLPIDSVRSGIVHAKREDTDENTS